MSFECPFSDCSRTFDSKKGLGVHRSRSHENRFEDREWLEQKYVNERMDTKDKMSYNQFIHIDRIKEIQS